MKKDILKIYVQDKPLFLIDAMNTVVEEYLNLPGTIFLDVFNISSVKTMLQKLDEPSSSAGILMHNNVEVLLDAFKSQLQVIVACGGLVHAEHNDVLLIYRKGKWDLPKGKLDNGEDLEACALREIAEETGADNLQIENPLTTTYHTYYEKGILILKESHWYLVNAVTKSTLSPQTEEDITECKWVPIETLSSYYQNAYPSVVDVLEAGKKFLPDITAKQ